MEKKYTFSDRSVMLMLYAIFAICSCFYAMHLSIPLVLDETSTIANTAFLAGDDWSISVQSTGGFYYKPGQAILYLPIYLFFRNNPFLMYKAMIVFNMLFISWIPVIAYYICRKEFQINSQIKSLLLAVCGGGISSIWLYSVYARSDMMMIFLPWLLVLLILKLSKATKEQSIMKRNLYSLLLAFVSVYAYMCHSRGIVLLIATVMTLLIATIIYKNKLVNYFIYIPATAVFLVIDKFVSGYFKSGIYGIYGTQHASIENVEFNKLLLFFTPKGFVIAFKLCIGWLFNLFASSMGLVIIGVMASVVIIFLGIKKKNTTMQENIFSVFSLLCILGTFALGVLFFFPHVYDLMTGVDLRRSDRMIYGRYTVGAVGPLCLLALYTLTCKKDQMIQWKARLSAILIYIVTFAICITKVIPQITNLPQTNLRYFISLCGFVKLNEFVTSAAFPDLTSALFKAGIASLIVMLVILFFASFKKNEKLLYSTCIVVFAMSFINFNHVFYNYRDSRDNWVGIKTQNIIKYMGNIKGIDQVSEEYPIVLRDCNAFSVKFYQFGLPKFNVGDAKYVKDYGYDNFVIISKKNKIDESILNCSTIYGPDNYYLFKDFEYDTAFRDVILVKGDQLAELLIKNGNQLIPYTQNADQ